MTWRDYTRKPFKGPLECHQERSCQVLCEAEYTQPVPLLERAVKESFPRSTVHL